MQLKIEVVTLKPTKAQKYDHGKISLKKLIKKYSFIV